MRPSEGNDSSSRSSGQIGHIVAASPNGPRYGPMGDAERASESNALFLCSPCHFVIIDNKDNAAVYTEDAVRRLKALLKQT